MCWSCGYVRTAPEVVIACARGQRVDGGELQWLIRIEDDGSEVDALVVGRFDAVDQRAALDCDAPANGIDPWIRRGDSCWHFEVENDVVAGGPRPFDAHVTTGIIGRGRLRR